MKKSYSWFPAGSNANRSVQTVSRALLFPAAVLIAAILPAASYAGPSVNSYCSFETNYAAAAYHPGSRVASAQNVNTAPSTDAYLSGLKMTGANISPSFTKATTTYTANVKNATASTMITPTTFDPTSTVTVNGKAVASGTPSAALPLAVGPNVFTIVVTAQDGTTKQTYMITVTRPPSANASLAGLTITGAVISPAFAKTTYSYTASVPNAAVSTRVTATIGDPTATFTVNGTAVASGIASSAIPLIVGSNTITIRVTSQAGTINTVKIVVTRAPSSNAYLSGLTISGLSFSFSPTNFHYAIGGVIPYYGSPATFHVTATCADAAATITINGKSAKSGTTLSVLVPGGPDGGISASITTTVTAQDGSTQNSYTVRFTFGRYFPVNNVYIPVSVGTPVKSPQLAQDGIKVHQGVSPNGDGINDFLLIENISNYPDNKLMIMNRSGQLVFEANGYDNSSKVFDGHSNKTGAMQLPGTYFYSLDYVVNGLTKHATGFIVLKY